MFHKRLFLLVGVALLAVLLWSLAGKESHASYEEAKEMLKFRRIGHELLLTAGDKNSRVLPIQKTAAGQYRIAFEKPFAFLPDSLVSVLKRVLDPVQLTSKYVVNVVDVKSREVVWGCAIPFTSDAVSCGGRLLPAAQYTINILYPDAEGEKSPSGSLAWPVGIAALLSVALVIFAIRFSKTKKVMPVTDTAFTAVGRFRFYPGRHLLIIEQSSIELTAKETKLLQIFSAHPNEVIDRNQLLKEGWEDEGVITGRSLDMYVSKLRKKLQADELVSIMNVHGKGYRLNC